MVATPPPAKICYLTWDLGTAENLVDTVQANILEMVSSQRIVRQLVDAPVSLDSDSQSSSNGSSATETQPIEGRRRTRTMSWKLPVLQYFQQTDSMLSTPTWTFVSAGCEVFFGTDGAVNVALWLLTVFEMLVIFPSLKVFGEFCFTTLLSGQVGNR